MKKLITMLMVLTMVLSLAACGKSDKTNTSENNNQPQQNVEQSGTNEENQDAETPDQTQDVVEDENNADVSDENDTVTDENQSAAEGSSPAQILLADFMDKMNSGTEYTAEEMATELSTNAIIPFMAGAMPVEEGFLNGFTEEIHGFAEGANFGPMISTIPFTGYVFKLADDADVDAFVQNLKDKGDLNWNICTQADEMVCEAVGQTVFFIMCPASFED